MSELVFPYNFHTHSLYCDGNDSLFDMAKAAYEKGFRTLGFSGHLYVGGTSVSMSDGAIEAYKDDIAVLKKMYDGKMDILCGAEADFFDDHCLDGFEYVIQSVHDIKVEEDGETFYIPLDHKEEITVDAVERYFGGDWYALAEYFFDLEGQIAEKDRVDIIGHFDYLSKYNKNQCLFREDEPRYIAAWKKAVDRLLPLGKPFEINTSVFYRGMRDRPYPADDILEYIFSKGGKITFSGDVHSKERLYAGFEDAIARAKRIGFTSAVVLTKDGPKDAGI